MTGMFAGVLLTGLSFASLRQFYESTSYGVWTVPQLLHVPYGVIVGVLLLAGMFAFRRAAPVFAIVALVTATAGSPYMTRYVDPMQLASWIKDRKPGLEIVDTRSPQEFATVHVPGSQNVRSEPRDAIVVRADGGVYLLRGGIDGWVNNVLKAPRPTPLTRYFGGVRRGGC
jgi:rhodanese-like protein